MLELSSVPLLEGFQPLSRDEIGEIVLSWRPDYSKCLGWSHKPNLGKSGSNSLSLMSQEIHDREVRELKANLTLVQSRIK